MPSAPRHERTLCFPAGDADCDATLSLPTSLPTEPGTPTQHTAVEGATREGVSAARLPVIVMAHGFGAERSFGLRPFVDRFVDAGFAVLCFDYRGFGRSGGQPRYLVDPARHVQDYLAAIDAVAEQPELDPARIGLWGTSFSGGHVLVAAAQRPQVRAVSSQVPFVDGLASTAIYPLGLQLPAAAAGMWDMARAALGLSPHYVPIVGPGLCALAGDDCVEGYGRLMPADATHPGHVAARIFLTLPGYRPIRSAPKVSAPVLMVGAEHDSLIPIAAVEKTARALPDCTFERLPIGHFDPYSGPVFEQVVALQTDFFRRKL